jgi:hypothetical protein
MASAPSRKERPGCLVFSERFFPARAHDPEEPGEIARLSQDLPSVLDPFLPSQPSEADTAAEKPARELDWLLWIEPVGLSPEVHATLKPSKPTEIHWLPAQPSAEELGSLKKALALRLMEKSASNDFAASDLNLPEEIKSTLANPFGNSSVPGKIITDTHPILQPRTPERRSLRSLVSTCSNRTWTSSIPCTRISGANS